MATISYLTRIEFGEGEIARLGEHLATLGVTKPLIVTDKGLVGAGLAGGVIAMLGSAHAVFDGTPANPTEEAALAARALYLSEGCDGVVGLGGGSALDLAKAVRLLSGHEPPLAQYTAVSGGAISHPFSEMLKALAKKYPQTIRIAPASAQSYQAGWPASLLGLAA